MDQTTIQRVLFLTPNVHVYQIPPLTSNKGFNASSWTAPPHPTAQQIFTARLRIVETSKEDSALTIEILLEDPNSSELFAGAPYTSPAVVQQALDSSRFFAVRVQGDGGMKATLGIGFEDRSPAFDFAIALGEVRKILGWEGQAADSKAMEQESKKDLSLKEGQKIHIEVGNKGGRRQQVGMRAASGTGQDDGAALFSIAPPPPAGKASEGFHPPVQNTGSTTPDGKSAQELGFDDGEFGEFQ